MNRYSTLHFFDKAGREIPTVWVDDNGLYHATVYIPEVSTNLFETEAIYVVQEGHTGTNVDYFSPFVSAINVTKTSANSAIEASFLDGSVFSLFSVSDMTAINPEVRLETSIRRQHTFLQTAVLGKHIRVGDDDIEDGTFQDGVPVVDPTKLKREAFRFDICLHSTQPGTFEDRLILRDLNLDGEVIVEIYVYGEVIGEDERLQAKLADFGEFLAKQDESLFRHSDINEDLVDAVLLNNKRKEFLLEMHNIKPYLSSYRGILNVLQLFDYPDLTLKEYWLNKTTGKLIPETVRLDETQENNTNLNVDPNLRKTTLFGLYYPMNRVVEDKWNEDGTPVTEETFLFSHEEVLLKLFGLRRWIERRDIGGWSTILDVIGEKTFFNLYRIVFFEDRWARLDVPAPERDLRFTINGQENDDVRDERHLQPIVVFLEDKNFPTDMFDEDVNRTPTAHLTLRNITAKRTYGDVDMSYGALVYPAFPVKLTYNNISWYEYYGIEYSVKNQTTGEVTTVNDLVTNDNYRIFESARYIDLHEIEAYDVNMKLYKYNGQSSLTKTNAIQVYARKPQLLMFTKAHSPQTRRLTFGDMSNHMIGYLTFPYSWITSSTFENVDYERMLLLPGSDIQKQYFDLIPDTTTGTPQMVVNDDDLLTYRNIDENLDGLLIEDVPNTYYELDNVNFNPSALGDYHVSMEQIRVRPMTSVYFSVFRFFGFFLSRIAEAMVGQQTATWTLTDENNTTVRHRTSSLYFHHLFFHKGRYNVTLEVEDVHGNKSTLHRKNAVVVC